MRHAALLLATVPLAGCVYFNGIYNARQAQKRGDALLRDGRSAEADSLFTTAAQKAETVLVHHPRSRWAPDAMFIAGWSWAMASRCDRAVPRLTSVLTRSEETEARLGRATLALGVCRVRERRYAAGRALLAPLARGADRQLARDASLWAALASVALGEEDSARAYLRTASVARADWALARAYLDRGDAAAAESLLVRRAAHGDFRDDLLDELRTLWEAGHADAVERIVARYDGSRVATEDRARLHMLAGELSLAADADSAARAHFAAVASLSRDSTRLREAAARLTLAELHGLTSVVDVANVIAAGRARAAGSPLLRRMEDDLLLLQLLHDRDDDTGASLFLAAEVARDSLRAPALARALFHEVAAQTRSQLAEKAMRAAAQVGPPESAAPGTKRDTTKRDTVVARAAYGELESSSPAAGDGGPAVEPADALLARAWRRVVAQYADSLRRLHPDSGAANAAAPRAPVRPAPPGAP
ncbi:MAG TPA: hypothetical protein VFS44_10325 [Gemmatimonadaceae bacterium]|nr:hypothetical protein [Gemmatimonadaceae bacterium]